MLNFEIEANFDLFCYSEKYRYAITENICVVQWCYSAGSNRFALTGS